MPGTKYLTLKRAFKELIETYENNRGQRTAALLDSLTPSKIAPGKTIYRKRLIAEAKPFMTKSYTPRGTYDNGVVYSRRFRLILADSETLARIIAKRINRLIKRRTKQRMAPIKAKRIGTSVYIFVAKGGWQPLEPMLPSMFHHTNLIIKYFEKGYNV